MRIRGSATVGVWRYPVDELGSSKSPLRTARHNSQEDVFADCRGLIGSAVDGFNVTVPWPRPDPTQ